MPANPVADVWEGRNPKGVPPTFLPRVVSALSLKFAY